MRIRDGCAPGKRGRGGPGQAWSTPGWGGHGARPPVRAAGDTFPTGTTQRGDLGHSCCPGDLLSRGATGHPPRSPPQPQPPSRCWFIVAVQGQFSSNLGPARRPGFIANMPWMERAAPGRLQPIYIHLHKAPSRPARRALTRQFVCWSQRGAVIGREAPRRRHGERNGDVPRPPRAGFWDRQRAPRAMDRARRRCTVHKDHAPCVLHHGPCTAVHHAPCTMTVHRMPCVTHHGPRTMTVHHARDRAPRTTSVHHTKCPCPMHLAQLVAHHGPGTVRWARTVQPWGLGTRHRGWT